MAKTCNNCFYATWQRTPTGRIKRNEPGRCELSLEWIKNRIEETTPACITHVDPWKVCIWPNSEHECPYYEEKE